MATGDIKLSSNFELNSQRALDARSNVASMADRDAIPLIQRYDRMIVAVQGGETYQLKLGFVDNNLANNQNWDYFRSSSSHDQNTDDRILNQGATVSNTPSQYNIANTKGFVKNLTLASQSIIQNFSFWNLGSSLDNFILEIYEGAIAGATVVGQTNNTYLSIANNLLLRVNCSTIVQNGWATFKPGIVLDAGNYSLVVYRKGKLNEAISYHYGAQVESIAEYRDLIDSGVNNVQISGALSYLRFKIDYSDSIVKAKSTELEIAAPLVKVKADTIIKKNLTVEGNIIQNGIAYETHAEQLYTQKDLIILRENAVSALPTNTYSGFKIIKYNGTNNLIFATDNAGIARIGVEGGSLQALATREDTPLNGGYAKWNSSTFRFECVDLSNVFAPYSHTHNYEPVINPKNTAFNLNLGTTAGTVAEGNHTHNYEPVISVKKTAFNVDFGTTAGTAAQGNHTHSGTYQPVLTNPVTGTGTANYLSKFTSGSTIGNSIIYDDSVNLKIALSTGFNLKLGDYGALGLIYSSASTVIGNNVCASNAANEMINMVTHAYSGAAIVLNGLTGIDFHTKEGGATAGASFSSLRMSIIANGNVGINVPNPTEKLDLLGNIKVRSNTNPSIYIETASATRRATLYFDTTNGFVMLHNNASDSGLKIYNDGHSTFGGSVTASNFILSSDIRLKENVGLIGQNDIDSISFVKFNFKDDRFKRKRYGVIAQEVELSMPELVYTDEMGYKQVAYIDLLIAKIASLENRLKAMERK